MNVFCFTREWQSEKTQRIKTAFIEINLQSAERLLKGVWIQGKCKQWCLKGGVCRGDGNSCEQLQTILWPVLWVCAPVWVMVATVFCFLQATCWLPVVSRSLAAKTESREAFSHLTNLMLWNSSVLMAESLAREGAALRGLFLQLQTTLSFCKMLLCPLPSCGYCVRKITAHIPLSDWYRDWFCSKKLVVILKQSGKFSFIPESSKGSNPVQWIFNSKTKPSNSLYLPRYRDLKRNLFEQALLILCWRILMPAKWNMSKWSCERAASGDLDLSSSKQPLAASVIQPWVTTWSGEPIAWLEAK